MTKCPTGKIPHPTIVEAKRHARAMLLRTGDIVDPYFCLVCAHYHVGHPRKPGEIPIMTEATTLTSEDLTDAEREALTQVRAVDQRMARLTEPEPEVVKGIWDDDTKLFPRYRVELRFTGKVMGGIPQRPDIIEAWIRKNTGVTEDEETRAMAIATLKDLGVEVPANATFEDLVETSKKMASETHGNAFKSDSKGLYLEDRQIKAMLKESCAIVYPWDGGKNKFRGKTPRSALAEWVFVDEPRIHLGRMEPDGTHLQVGQVSGPQGKRSTLTYYSFALQPTISFTVLSFQDLVTQDQWKQILTHAQRNGLGALRSQSHGQFRITAFDKL